MATLKIPPRSSLSHQERLRLLFDGDLNTRLHNIRRWRASGERGPRGVVTIERAITIAKRLGL